MIRGWFALGAWLLVLGLAGSPPRATAAELSARIRVIHAAPDAPPVGAAIWGETRVALPGEVADAIWRSELGGPLIRAGSYIRVADALADPGGHAWLLASGSAIDALVRAAAPAGATLEAATAVATHARIAEQARSAGFGRILLAETGFASVVRCIESAHP